jgi:phosphoheptose isomerase
MSFQAQLSRQIELLQQLQRDSFTQTLNKAIELMRVCLQQQKPLLICGNG